MKYEIEYIEKIAKIVADNNLTEITLEDGEQAIVVRKEANVVTTSVVPTVAAPAPAAAATIMTTTTITTTPTTCSPAGVWRLPRPSPQKN